MELEIIKHKNILFRDILRAIAIKTVAWPHPLESQVKWIVDNMHNEDLHVFLKEEDKDVAYSTLSPVLGILNGNPKSFLGLGCVCSVKRGVGYGRVLVMQVNEYLMSNNAIGLLFCKDAITDFYEKYDWIVIPEDRVMLAETTPKAIKVMLYNCNMPEKLIYSGKMF